MVGATGQNNKGFFEVIGMRNSNPVVKYQDGTIAVISLQFIEKFITSFEKKEQTTEKDAGMVDFYKMVGYFTRNCFLSVDINPTYWERFKEMYYRIKGVYPAEKSKGYYPHSGEKCHDHIRFKVVFPNVYGIAFDKYKVLDLQTRKVIYSMKLGLALLKMGFELGGIQKKENILPSIPQIYHDDFMYGYNK